MNEVYEEYFRIFLEKAPKIYTAPGYGYETGKPNPMASSLESCLEFSKIIKENDVLLNAGAGASSWIFRKLFKHVFCADSNAGYLQAVKDIVGGENYIVGLDSCPVVDFVYWDYGSNERVPLMNKAFSLARKAMYVDDCHASEVFLAARNMAQEHDCVVSEPLGHDCYGRFGVIVTRKTRG